MEEGVDDTRGDRHAEGVVDEGKEQVLWMLPMVASLRRRALLSRSSDRRMQEDENGGWHVSVGSVQFARHERQRA